MPSEESPELSQIDLVNHVRYTLGSVSVSRVTAADVDGAVLRVYGLAPMVERLWLETSVVSKNARRRVRLLLKERFGARSPRGPLSIWIFLVTLSMTLPIGSLLGTLRRGFTEGVPLAATSSPILGALLLLGIATTLGRPVDKPTIFQTQFIALVLSAAGVLGFVISSGFTRVGFVAGAALAIVALALATLGRTRDKVATALIDNAREVAHRDVASEVAAERDRILATLPAQLADSTADLDAMRAMRTAAITTFHAEGSSATDPAPMSLPGTYIVESFTNAWLPAPWPPKRTGRR